MPRATNGLTNDVKWDQLATNLADSIAKAAAAGITMSISLTDLSHASCHASLALGSDKRVEAASVIKLGVLVVLMDKVDRGQLKLAQLVHVAVGSDDIVGGTGTMQNRHFPLDISVDELAHLMIQVSDNSAANVLIDLVGGFDPVNAYLNAHGFSDLWLGRKLLHPAVPPLQENYITATGVDDLLVRVWDGTIVSRQSSDYIINLMRGQQVNTKFGAVVPRQFLANKTGELDNVQHDAGFITVPGGELALVTTTSYSGLDATFVDTFVQRTATVAFQFSQTSSQRPPVRNCASVAPSGGTNG
jgi:beta-lactamase class A